MQKEITSFDLISDIHLDFHLNRLCINTGISCEQGIVKIAHSIIPDLPSPVLVIAGDLGHCNKDNASFLKELSNFYQHILFTFGNHDFYLIYDDFKTSLERWHNMKELAEQIRGVTILDGNTITIDGYTFGGTGMWYDYSYGLSLGYSIDTIVYAWMTSFNDSRYMIGCPSSEKEKEKLDKIIDDCDVIVTHISPDPSKIRPKFKKGISSAFFYFDNTDFINRISGKIWCSGHSHDRLDYNWNGCRMVSHDLGYPGELSFSTAMTVKLS